MPRLIFIFTLLLLTSCGGSDSSGGLAEDIADSGDSVSQTTDKAQLQCEKILTTVGYYDSTKATETCGNIFSLCRSENIANLDGKQTGNCVLASVGIALIPSEKPKDSFQYCGTNLTVERCGTYLGNLAGASSPSGLGSFGASKGALDWWVSSIARGEEVSGYLSTEDVTNGVDAACGTFSKTYPPLAYSLLTGCPVSTNWISQKESEIIPRPSWVDKVSAEELFYWQYNGGKDSRFASAECSLDGFDCTLNLPYLSEWGIGYRDPIFQSCQVTGSLSNTTCFPAPSEVGSVPLYSIVSDYETDLYRCSNGIQDCYEKGVDCGGSCSKECES